MNYPIRKKSSPRDIARMVAGGFAVGVVGGIFGSGGGIVAILLLSATGMGKGREIFANVSAAILPMSLASALVYSSFSPPDVFDAVSVAAASLAGGAVGALLLGRIGITALKRIFAFLMIVSGAVMLFWG